MNPMPGQERFFAHLLHGSAPLLVWALHFFAAYVLVATACCTAFAQTEWGGIAALRLCLWALSALAAGAIAAMVTRSLRLPQGLRRSAGAGGGLLALLAVVWTTLPMLGDLPLCACQP